MRTVARPSRPWWCSGPIGAAGSTRNPSSTGAERTWRHTNIRGSSDSSTPCPSPVPARSCGASCRNAKPPPLTNGRLPVDIRPRHESASSPASMPECPARRIPMKALLSKHPGGPETLVLDEVPEPIPGSGEVRIAVRACGVNYPDLLIIQDLYQYKPLRPFAPGAEVAGVVDAVGEGVLHLRAGDRVLMSPVRNGMAEKAVGLGGNCWKIPDAMPFDQAAALIMTYSTSQHALKDRAQLRAGETLLVLGAAGGVGLAAVELGKVMGARVIAAASSAEKVALAREHGADEACNIRP